MSRNIIETAIYYRKDGRKKVYITVPVKNVFLGVDDTCSAILSRSIIGPDGLRYYFECVNLAEII